MGVVKSLGPRRFIDGELVLKPAGRSRLALCRPSSGTLKLVLGLLGIPSLERMGGGDMN
jgi:arginyl-tRNA synthetase